MGHRRLSASAALVVAAGLIVGCGGRARAVQPLPAAICSPLERGQSTPRLLVVSDLPMRGAFRSTTEQMARAIRYTFAAHGYRAGRFAVGYQSCDDSSADVGNYSPDRCAANMKAYAASRDVVAVLGPFNSECAQFQIPIANGGRDGPLAMLSPANTRVGLTHAAPGTASREPQRYYPAGIRNYARIVPADDAQAAALVKLARSLGARRIAIVSDGEDYGDSLASMLRAAAGRAGLAVASQAVWDPRSQQFGPLARRVAAERPDAVVVSGLWQLNGVSVVRELRRAIGPRTPLLATDGFASLPHEATRAAAGTYVAAAGLPPDRMGPLGRDIVRRFGAGQLPGLGAPYAAQAAEAVLAAIARSDGTRRSVVRELLREHIRGGVLGPVGFDRNGDILARPVSIYRVGSGGLSLARVVVA